MKIILIFSLITILMLSFIIISLPNAYAADFQISIKCNADNLNFTFIDKDGNTIQNVGVHTLDGIRDSNPNDTFYSNELGQASIPFLDNTGFVMLSKPGFNNQKMNVETCDPNKVPPWIKNNAKWWIEGQIDENSFLEGLRFLIKEDILEIPDKVNDKQTGTTCKKDQVIPSWVATNVEWWADDIINDDTFLLGIQYLVTNKIIDLSENRIDCDWWTNESPDFNSMQTISKDGESQTRSQSESTQCPSDYPYRWNDGQCWNLPQDYETQVQLECPSGYPYVWSDDNCYNVPECTSSYPYRGSDGQCYNVPECTSDFPYRWADNQCYNRPQCTDDYPYRWADNQCYNVPECSGYLWSDGQCHNLMECSYDYPYRWADGNCYNQLPPPECMDYQYDTGYGYCCSNDMYTEGDGICRSVEVCPAGYYEVANGCCPKGTYDPGDGTCRYP